MERGKKLLEEYQLEKEKDFRTILETILKSLLNILEMMLSIIDTV